MISGPCDRAEAAISRIRALIAGKSDLHHIDATADRPPADPFAGMTAPFGSLVG
jgi:hypothetical protein